MSTIGERLREERQRLDLNQTEMGEMGGVQKRAQINYESGERSPDSNYLAAIAKAGADIRYIVTGEREGPPPLTLSQDEKELLSLYRSASKELRASAIGGLRGGMAGSRVVVHGDVGNQVQGNITHVAPVTFNMGGKKKK